MELSSEQHEFGTEIVHFASDEHRRAAAALALRPWPGRGGVRPVTMSDTMSTLTTVHMQRPHRGSSR